MAFPMRPGRIDLKVPIALGVNSERMNAETRNIGLGGVFVAASAPLRVGQHVPLNLTLPGWDEPLVVTGETRWIRASEDGRHGNGVPGMGFRFVRCPLYVVAALDNFVRSHARDR